MMKLGSRWQMQRYEQRKKRAPGEVSKDLEARMLENGKALLSSSVAKRSAPKIEKASFSAK